MNKFRAYARETAELCIELYNWYPMPPSVHKALIHGPDIMETFDLSIGLYSEEPQENNNKRYRKARAEYSRMMSRQETNEDTFKFLMANSDPFLSSYRIVLEKSSLSKTKEAEELLR